MRRRTSVEGGGDDRLGGKCSFAFTKKEKAPRLDKRRKAGPSRNWSQSELAKSQVCLLLWALRSPPHLAVKRVKVYLQFWGLGFSGFTCSSFADEAWWAGQGWWSSSVRCRLRFRLRTLSGILEPSGKNKDDLLNILHSDFIIFQGLCNYY